MCTFIFAETLTARKSFCLLMTDSIKIRAKVDKFASAREFKNKRNRDGPARSDIHKFYEAPRRREDERTRATTSAFACAQGS